MFSFTFPSEPLKNLSIIFCWVGDPASNNDVQVSKSPLLPTPSPKSTLKLGSEKKSVVSCSNSLNTITLSMYVFWSCTETPIVSLTFILSGNGL